MTRIYFPGGSMSVSSNHKPGDREPANATYLDWHSWAEVQHKAGLRQVECGRCGLWRYPQDLSSTVDEKEVFTKRGKPVTVKSAVCLKCLPVPSPTPESQK